LSSRRRHTRFKCDWSSDVCSSDLGGGKNTWHVARGSFVAGLALRLAAIDLIRGRSGGIRGTHPESRRRPAQNANLRRLAQPFPQIGRASCREREEVIRGTVVSTVT